MADPTGIFNWRRLDDRLTTSGQPTEEQLQAIAALGARTVVNLGLHTHEKALADETASLAALGVDYIHQPVEFALPTDTDLAVFFATMDRLRDQPIHVHCIANYRVSAFLYRYRVDVLGWDKAEARHDLDAIWVPYGAWVDVVDRA